MSSTSAASSASRARSASAPLLELLDAGVRPPRARARHRRASARRRTLLRPDERVEQVELVRGPRQTALLELARHREQALGRGDDVLARDAAAPGVGARAPVGADPPRDDEARLVVRPQLAQRLEPLLVEEPVRARRARPRRTPRRPPAPTEAASPFAPSSRPIAWVEDRLPGAGLARERVRAPASSASSASRIRTRFSIRRLRSTWRS